MNDYQPTVGDHVRATAVHEGVITFASGEHFTLKHDGDGSVMSGQVSGRLSFEVLPPAEEWRLGDVVRNADDPEDKQLWFLADESDAPWLSTSGDLWFRRNQLPANLLLLVRDGQPVAQPQPEPTHPQPGDVVTEEPPVGSVVRDLDGDSWTRKKAEEGWGISDGQNDWSIVTQYVPLTLVRWGGAA